MPKMGESIMEATVLKWHKATGDHVKMDETLLDIATDKVDSEVPSTAAGVITELLYKENDVVPVGAIIAKIDSAGAQPAAAPVAQPQSAAAQPQPQAAPKYQAAPAAHDGGSRFYSPLVLNIAGKEGISMSELEAIPGTGSEGRVTKKDILSYVADRGNVVTKQVFQAPPQAQAPAQQPIPQQMYTPPATAGGNVEIMEMDRMRKLIAEHMVRSKATSPHVTSFTEADVTNIVKWRDKVKGNFEKKYGDKITYTPIFFEAIINCIRRFPLINCSLDGDKIIIRRILISVWLLHCLPVTS